MSVIVGLVYSIAVGILIPINLLSEKMWARVCSLLGIVLLVSLRFVLEMKKMAMYEKKYEYISVSNL